MKSQQTHLDQLNAQLQALKVQLSKTAIHVSAKAHHNSKTSATTTVLMCT
jgi:hypothetical protein